jgi:hypothetical protein
MPKLEVVHTAAKPFRGIPQRLTAKNAVETLQQLGVSISSIAAQAEIPAQRFGIEQAASPYAVSVARVDEALQAAGIRFSESLRFKHALDRLGLLK